MPQIIHANIRQASVLQQRLKVPLIDVILAQRLPAFISEYQPLIVIEMCIRDRFKGCSPGGASTGDHLVIIEIVTGPSGQQDLKSCSEKHERAHRCQKEVRQTDDHATRSAQPVSYTHLDVYKRQALGRIG